MEKLELYFSRLMDFLRKIPDAPRVMWEGSASEPGMRLLLICFAVAFAGGALYLLISFIKAPWKEKGRMLFVGLVVLIVILTIFYFALMT